MKFIYLGLAAFLFFACNTSTSTDLEDQNKKNISVKTDLEIMQFDENVKSLNKITYYADIEMDDSVGGLSYREYTEFSKTGFISMKESYGSGDFRIFKSIMHYDETGKLSEVKSLDDYDELKTTELYFYDELGFCNKKSILNADGNEESYKIIKTNDKGYVLETKHYASSKDGLMVESTAIYAGDRMIEGTFHDVFSNIVYKYKYFYDENGVLISTEQIDDVGIVMKNITYKYFYSEQGETWVKRLEFDRGRLIYITLREFEYY